MKKIVICVNYRANPNQPSCAARGSEEIAQCIEQEIAKRHLAISVERFYCLGHCAVGPNLHLAPNGRLIHWLTKEDIPELLLEIEEFSRDQHT